MLTEARISVEVQRRRALAVTPQPPPQQQQQYSLVRQYCSTPAGTRLQGGRKSLAALTGNNRRCSRNHAGGSEAKSELALTRRNACKRQRLNDDVIAQVAVDRCISRQNDCDDRCTAVDVFDVPAPELIDDRQVSQNLARPRRHQIVTRTRRQVTQLRRW